MQTPHSRTPRKIDKVFKKHLLYQSPAPVPESHKITLEVFDEVTYSYSRLVANYLEGVGVSDFGFTSVLYCTYNTYAYSVFFHTLLFSGG